MVTKTKHSVYALVVALLVASLPARIFSAEPSVMDRAACMRYYEAFVETTRNLQVAISDPKTQKAFNQLDPTKGTGFLTFDVTGALPKFLQGDNYKQVDWPEKGTFVFDGDKSVPHYV
ncbi:MAG: hypothetical protein KDD39_13925, partial [Bdellovibrionales bacterium]|nr:hypothetical protein [Bdellovibrionales bacterium]